MRHPREIDLSTLSPVERIALADVLYDSAMQEIDEHQHLLSPEELAEIDRRLARLESENERLVPWDDVRSRLMQAR